MKAPRAGSKAAAVLAALRRRAGLTSMEAFAIGETTLPSTVYALRRAGHNIVGKPHKSITRYGCPCRYLRYRAIKPPSKENTK